MRTVTPATPTPATPTVGYFPIVPPNEECETSQVSNWPVGTVIIVLKDGFLIWSPISGAWEERPTLHRLRKNQPLAG
jgi:hypothetical protein